MFDRLLGNERAKETIRRMLNAGRVPGGLLFAGEDGVGKKLFALELAKALNCRARVGVEACDKCASCTRITHSTFPPFASEDENKKRIIWGEHADVALVRPYNRLIRIVPMREIEREANFRPFEGAARIFIIEDADKLNIESSNALLKTLEEPPVTSHLILITARPAALLPTIRSRCQVIRFAPLAATEIEEHLTRAKKVSTQDARVLARLSQGSIGRALTADLENYRARREAMLGVLNALVLTGDRARLLRAAEEMNDAKRKDEYEPRLDVLEILIRDVWALALGAPAGQIVNEDLRAQLSQLGARVESRRAAGWLKMVETLRGQLSVNINRKVATDALFLAMARPQ
jgi:DNA polymerase-3 subunit delta'